MDWHDEEKSGRTSLRSSAFLVLLLRSVAPAQSRTDADPSVVRIGVLANRGADACLTDWTPTAQYLSLKVPGEVFFHIVPVDFENLRSMVENGQVEFDSDQPELLRRTGDRGTAWRPLLRSKTEIRTAPIPVSGG